MSDITRALQIGGMMRPTELQWLADQAEKHYRIVEIGSWIGRSTRALADNTRGSVYAVDTWAGSWQTDDDPDFQRGGPDWLYSTFLKNTSDCAAVIPYRMSSLDAAKLFEAEDLFDMIFIDGSHDYDNVRADILAWRPLLASGGLLCGHDYKYDPCDPIKRESFLGLDRAVEELVPTVKIAVDTIWYEA